MDGSPTQLPAFIQLRYSENGVFDKLKSDARSATGDLQRQFDSTFSNIGDTVTKALSVARNQGGSLDLGVNELRAAQGALEARAVAAEEVARATRAAAQAEGDYSQAARITTAAADALAREEREGAVAARSRADAAEQVQIQLNKQASATQSVIAATNRGTIANSQMVNSTRALRQATLQAGQQVQDIGISLVSGQRAGIVFAQQLPQLAFALSGLEGQANKTAAKIGKFATFLAGPWGLAVGLAVGVLGTLVASMFESSDAADDASDANLTLAEKLDATKRGYEAAAEAAREYNKDVAKSAQTSLQAAQALAIQTEQLLLQSQQKQIERKAALDELKRLTNDPGPKATGSRALSRAPSVVGLERSISSAQTDIEDQILAVRNSKFSLAKEQAAIQGDTAKAIKESFENARQEISRTVEGVDATRAALLKLDKQEKAALENQKGSEKSNQKNTSGGRAAAAARRETERLAEFGGRAAESIEQINERFNEQRRLIDQANQATSKLDETIKELRDRKPPGFEGLIEQALDAKGVIVDALQRPYEDLIEASEQRLQIEELIANGRVDEAQALQDVWQLERNIGDVSDERRAIILDTIRYERERSRELARQRDLLDAQLNVLDTARAGLQDLFSGRSTDLFGDLKQSIDDLRGARFVDDIFGDVFAQLEDELSKNSPLGKASKALADEVTVTSTSAKTLGTEFINLAEVTKAAAASISSATTFDEAFAEITGAANDNAGGIIEVNGASTPITEIARLSISQIADKTAAAFLAPLLDGLKDILGTGFTQSLGTVLQGALSGFIQGGKVGGVIGGAKGLSDELFGEKSKLSGRLSDSLDGAQTGSTVAGIGNALGLGLSNTGAQIGGAIGSLIPIPGGDIIGSIAGGVISKLFGGKTAAAVIRGPNDVTLRGADGKNFDKAEGLAGTVISGLQNIADKFDANIGSFFATIGTRGGEFRVNPTGDGLKKKKGAVKFGDDEAAAIAFAISDAIKDGALLGLRASTMRLLQAGSDIEKQLAKAVSFEDVFKRLRNIKDPVGAAIDGLNKEFTRLKTIFQEAGASVEEFAQLEELYGIERAQAVKDAGERISGSLRSLFDELTIGDSGLSLRIRRENAVDKFQPLAERVAAGDVTAFDDFADASRALLDIERQIFGSQEDFFNRLTEITDLTKTRIDEIDNATSIAAGSDGPFDSSGAVRDSIDTQTGELANRLDAINQNLIRLSGSGILPSAPTIASTNDFNQIRQVINF